MEKRQLQDILDDIVHERSMSNISAQGQDMDADVVLDQMLAAAKEKIEIAKEAVKSEKNPVDKRKTLMDTIVFLQNQTYDLLNPKEVAFMVQTGHSHEKMDLWRQARDSVQSKKPMHLQILEDELEFDGLRTQIDTLEKDSKNFLQERADHITALKIFEQESLGSLDGLTKAVKSSKDSKINQSLNKMNSNISDSVSIFKQDIADRIQANEDALVDIKDGLKRIIHKLMDELDGKIQVLANFDLDVYLETMEPNQNQFEYLNDGRQPTTKFSTYVKRATETMELEKQFSVPITPVSNKNETTIKSESNVQKPHESKVQATNTRIQSVTTISEQTEQSTIVEEQKKEEVKEESPDCQCKCGQDYCAYLGNQMSSQFYGQCMCTCGKKFCSRFVER